MLISYASAIIYAISYGQKVYILEKKSEDYNSNLISIGLSIFVIFNNLIVEVVMKSLVWYFLT